VLHYFLHIYERDVLVRDTRGIYCSGLTEAHREALKAISDLIKDGAWQPNSHGGRYISITDAEGNVLDQVMLWEAREQQFH
jgi:hypothetical protein